MRNYIYIALILLSAGCKPGIPKDIVQPDKMALILHDIHIVDGYIGSIQNMDSAKLVAASYYKGIYKKFNIDSALYTKSMDYYVKNPKTLDVIYTDVTASLTKEKAVVARADSVINAKEVKKIKLKMKADSAKKADSVKKITAKNTSLLNKAKLKKKTDSIKHQNSLKGAKK